MPPKPGSRIGRPSSQPARASLGTFSVEIGIGDPQGERWVVMDALVDTGASMTSAPVRP